MDKEPTAGLKPEQLARLLGVGTSGGGSGDRASTTQTTNEALRDRLDGAMPLDAAMVNALPAIVGRLCQELLPLTDRPLGEVLLDPKSDLDVIKAIKEYGKHLSARESLEPQHASAIALYYGAVASALVFHDKKISKHSYGSLERSFATLMGKRWMAPQLSNLLAKARKICQAKAK